jgi:hypothetical protein
MGGSSSDSREAAKFLIRFAATTSASGSVRLLRYSQFTVVETKTTGSAVTPEPFS